MKRYWPLLLIVFLFYCCFGKDRKDDFNNMLDGLPKEDTVIIVNAKIINGKKDTMPAIPCETMLYATIRDILIIKSQRDSLQRELNIIKGNKAAYDYAGDTNIIIDHSVDPYSQTKRFKHNIKIQ